MKLGYIYSVEVISEFAEQLLIGILLLNAKAKLIHDDRACSRKAIKLFLQLTTNFRSIRTVYTPSSRVFVLLAKEGPNTD